MYLTVPGSKNLKNAAVISALLAMFLQPTAAFASEIQGNQFNSATSMSNVRNECMNLTKDAKDATEYTAKANAQMYSKLDFDHRVESELATRGLIDAPESLELKDDKGNVVWSQDAFDFLKKYNKAPCCVNPSLWENAKDNHAYGLFKVMDGIYQVRGYDTANLTLVESDHGWIVFDTMMSVECTKAAMQLVEKNLGKRPVKAVIVSHSHGDHYGGIRALMTPQQAADSSLPLEKQLASGKIPIIVPEHYEEHVISENVYAGVAMLRRASYQYGVHLDRSEKGTLGIGLAMGQSVGTMSYISPTYEIKQTGETYNIDGVVLEFQMTPGTEAPAEMNTWLPQKNALWVAENCTGTLHNLYTLRGAQIRNGAAWAKYICEAVARYGKDVTVSFQSHQWPHYGNKEVVDYLVNTAAVYKFINDQTLTYLNQGYTTDEISNMIKLPAELDKSWYTRGYYGTVAHNSKAVYQRFLGWYDANPAHLNPLPPEESAKKWAEYMALGGVDAVLRKAKEDFEAGQYQWVAEVTNKLVFADPKNEAARLLCADAFEQLGYQTESGTWRNCYLTGALELRHGNASGSKKQLAAAPDIVQCMPASYIFDFMGILLNKEALADIDFSVNFNLTDVNEKYAIRFKNGAMLVFDGVQCPNASVTAEAPKNALFYMLMQQFEQFEKVAKIEGKKELLQLVTDRLNAFDPDISKGGFNIVEP